MEPILGSIISGVAPAHPLNKRYENCQNNEDEYEDVVDLEGSDLDAADDYEEGHVDDEFDNEKEVNSPMPKLSASNQEVN
ncbi:protein JASON-like [Prunus yedoensis var. nudiflora]|uniref:Protein JASON-like n=1 Tax=Prunus yedoensis var. nudiflora TaxID=2094558 RepID=A0A314UEK4_PRUYE|nr:protein JASON-like [Prunus yedoensis var. nudiflora]